MFLVPQETYDRLMSKNKKDEHISAINLKQLNNFDVNEGGKVTIRNDSKNDSSQQGKTTISASTSSPSNPNVPVSAGVSSPPNPPLRVSDIDYSSINVPRASPTPTQSPASSSEPSLPRRPTSPTEPTQIHSLEYFPSNISTQTETRNISTQTEAPFSNNASTQTETPRNVQTQTASPISTQTETPVSIQTQTGVPLASPISIQTETPKRRLSWLQPGEKWEDDIRKDTPLKKLRGRRKNQVPMSVDISSDNSSSGIDVEGNDNLSSNQVRKRLHKQRVEELNERMNNIKKRKENLKKVNTQRKSPLKKIGLQTTGVKLPKLSIQNITGHIEQRKGFKALKPTMTINTKGVRIPAIKPTKLTQKQVKAMNDRLAIPKVNKAITRDEAKSAEDNKKRKIVGITKL